MAEGSEFRVQGSDFRVQGSEFQSIERLGFGGFSVQSVVFKGLERRLDEYLLADMARDDLIEVSAV